MKSKIVCISGADGTGKSSVIENICRDFPGARKMSIWDIMKDPLIRDLAPFKTGQAVEMYEQALHPDARMLFLGHCLMQALQMAVQAGPDLIIADGYIYKYLASEVALGSDPVLAQNLLKAFPQPALMFRLQLDPRVAATRKTSYSLYECGFMASKSSEDFIHFQEHMLQAWERYFKVENEILIQADQSQEEVHALIRTGITNFINHK